MARKLAGPDSSVLTTNTANPATHLAGAAAGRTVSMIIPGAYRVAGLFASVAVPGAAGVTCEMQIDGVAVSGTSAATTVADTTVESRPIAQQDMVGGERLDVMITAAHGDARNLVTTVLLQKLI
jgi:hypothetical protein